MTKLTVAVVLALGAAAVLAAPAAATPASQAAGISSIAPATADRGGTVTIAGHGFGGPNVEITVGGISAEVLSATGSKATFRVPALAGPGSVAVQATNPAGHVGQIELTVRFDGNTVAVADAAAAVATAVGEDGGTIALEGMELTIPAGAVPEGTTITATPLRSLQGSPFAAAPVGLKLEPSGLVLLQPATLTLPRPAGSGAVVGFGFDGEGEELHLVPASVAGDSVELKVWHFSGAGTLTATLGELAAVLDYQTTRAHARAEQRIAVALIDAAENGSDPAQAIFDALSDWRRSVSNGLQIASNTARLDFFELAFGEWQAWLAYAQEYRDNLTATHNSFLDAAIPLDTATATEGAGAVARGVLARCVGPGVPLSALRDVIRLANAVVLAALPIDQVGDPGQRRLPVGDDLSQSCLAVEILDVEHAPAFARGRDNHFTAAARVVFWDGTASTTIPLRYRVADTTNAPVPVASGTSNTGSFDSAVHPGATGTRHYELTVDLDTGGNDTVLRTFFDRQTDVVPVRERLDLQARRPSDVAFGDLVGPVGPGGTVLLRVRLAGDDVAGKSIVLTHDGSGSVASSATTSSSGEAFLTYGAPATAQVELVTATITEAGLTVGDAVVITTVAPTPVGVSKVRNRAAVAAHCFGGPALDVLVSPDGATTFDESLACAGDEGAHSLASSFFRETLAGGRVTGIELRALADVSAGTSPNGAATAAGRYEIVFTADRSTSIVVSGSLSPCDQGAGKAELLLFSMTTGVIVARKTCTSPAFTAVLAPGQYILTVEAEAGSSEGNGRPTPTHAYAIQVAFTEPS
jgi:hypothetical protein